MKRVFLFIIIMLFLVAPLKGGATILITKSDQDHITIYAKKKDGLYYDFKIHFRGNVVNQPSWRNVTNPTYQPQIYLEDINNDVRKELIIILTKDYGTGALDQEVHVFHIKHHQLVEMIVDHPMAIVKKNIQSSLTPNKAEIIIGKKHHIINIKELNLLPENIFDEIYFGSIIKYKVKNNQLTVTLHPHLSPGAFVGNVIISYKYQDNMYQAKSIRFQFEDE